MVYTLLYKVLSFKMLADFWRSFSFASLFRVMEAHLERGEEKRAQVRQAKGTSRRVPFVVLAVGHLKNRGLQVVLREFGLIFSFEGWIFATRLDVLDGVEA